MGKLKLQEKTLESDRLVYEAQMQNNELQSVLASFGHAHAFIEYDLDGVLLKTRGSFRKLFGYSEQEIIGKKHEFLCEPDFVTSGAYDQLWEKLNNGEFEAGEFRCIGRDQSEIWIQSSFEPVLSPDRVPFKVIQFALDITEQKRLQKKLETASRQAGIAEVATGVLHNVGNVLNSVNVAANLLIEKAKNSPVDRISKAAEIPNENIDHLAKFLTEGPRGKNFPLFLNYLQEVRKSRVKELERLVNNVKQIKEIISVQQSFGKTQGIHEHQSVVELVEEAIHLNREVLEEDKIQLIREFSEVPLITTEKHKVLQILANLIKNGQEAVREANNINNILRIEIRKQDDQVLIGITDNGIGISKENMNNIFVHGFTTKHEGHGFGLHSCALSAQQLGGSLKFETLGVGNGATFLLCLPMKAPTA
ncbi:MAG: ATP-binding protein [Planctomycetota bacterium]|nr:ATP-binding protein [Planctomycetota bacterium]